MSSITTSSLSIVDRAGRPRLVLRLGARGEPELLFLDEAGDALIRLALTAAIDTLGKRHAAEFHLGAIDTGPQLCAVVNIDGDAFVELASGPTDIFAAALAEVGKGGVGHRAKLALSDQFSEYGLELRDGHLLH